MCGGGPHDDLRHLVGGEVGVVEGELAHTAPLLDIRRAGRDEKLDPPRSSCDTRCESDTEQGQNDPWLGEIDFQGFNAYTSWMILESMTDKLIH